LQSYLKLCLYQEGALQHVVVKVQWHPFYTSLSPSILYFSISLLFKCLIFREVHRGQDDVVLTVSVQEVKCHSSCSAVKPQRLCEH